VIQHEDFNIWNLLKEAGRPYYKSLLLLKLHHLREKFVTDDSNERNSLSEFVQPSSLRKQSLSALSYLDQPQLLIYPAMANDKEFAQMYHKKAKKFKASSQVEFSNFMNTDLI
jgi:hypothetical protein